STPPTSLGDDTSILSEVTKMEQPIEQQQEEEIHIPPASKLASALTQSAPSTPDNSARGRPTRSSRSSVVTYNVQILAGTAIHTPTKYLETHHGNVLHGPIDAVVQTPPSSVSPKKKRTPGLKRTSSDTNDSAEQQIAAETAQAAQRRSSRGTDLRREALRNLSGVGEAVANTINGGKELVQKALKRSASDSRLRSSTQTTASASAKRPRTARNAESEDVNTKDGEKDEEEKLWVKPKSKQWLTQGLFVGQTRGFDARLSGSQNRARLKSRKPKENTVLPLPMFTTGEALDKDPRVVYRDFKLPFDVYNPLLRKVKVDGWTKISKNRFIGEASALWKREKQDTSQCYCEVDDGCGEACHNRIMAYECDETNCRLTEDQCTNRPFADLKKRSKSNGYDYGVEVMQTEDKGYGVRAMRSFNPHQIIVEYAGEIITQDECERRMKQIYKKDK
ncbi:SET domain-containing protein, partial [Periconia macrospinosa]